MPENLKDERTGENTKRAALLRSLKALQDGDALIVWKLDRLTRSLRDLVSMLDDFHRRGIHFRSLTEEINTGTPGGKLIFHIFAALAERGLIIERTRARMKAARARGVRPGPKPKRSRQQIDHARKLIENGQRREDVAAIFNVGRVTLHRALAAFRVDPRGSGLELRRTAHDGSTHPCFSA